MRDEPSLEKLVIEAAKEALEAAVGWYAKRQKQRLKDQRIEALKSEALHSWVISYYNERGLADQLFGISVGKAVRRVAFLSRPEWQGLRKVRLSIDESWRSRVAVTELVQRRRELGYTIVDNQLYCLHRLLQEVEDVSLLVGVCRYEQFVSWCGLLEDETIVAATKSVQRTPLRDTAAPSLDVLATCPLGAHGIGVAATIVIESGQGRLVLLQERAYGTVTHGGVTAVVPMFAFQPLFGYVAEEFDLTHQFLREYGEELLGMPELQERSVHVAPDWFYSSPGIAEVRTLIEHGAISIQCSGFGFDAVNGEPNLALLVYIRSAEYWERSRRSLQRSWEAQHVFYAQLDPTYATFQANPLRWSPGSAFSFEMAVRALAAGA